MRKKIILFSVLIVLGVAVILFLTQQPDARFNGERKGYAREALQAVVDHAFRSGVHRVFAECDPRNEASWRLLESTGFRREAHFRQNIYFRKDAEGKPIWKDTYVYAITEEDTDRWRI